MGRAHSLAAGRKARLQQLKQARRATKRVCATGEDKPDQAASSLDEELQKNKQARSGIRSDDPSLAERPAYKGAGEALCKNCGFLYTPQQGDLSYPVPKGTQFQAGTFSGLFLVVRKRNCNVSSLIECTTGAMFASHMQDLPDDWTCPTCGTEKQFFQSKAKRVAGFEQNQGYGFGSNSLTSEQKSLLIYGVFLVLASGFHFVQYTYTY